MPDVTIQGTNTTVSFPDSMSDSDIQKVMSNHPVVKQLQATANGDQYGDPSVTGEKVTRSSTLNAAQDARNTAASLANQQNINRNLSEMGISGPQARAQGIAPAVQQAQVQSNKKRFNQAITANTQLKMIQNPDFQDWDMNMPAAQAELRAAPSLPGWNQHAAALATRQPLAQANTSFTGAVLDRLAGQPGTSDELNQMKGYAPALARGVMGFGEPTNLAMMLASAGLANPIASKALLGVFGAQAGKGAYDQMQQGDWQGALGSLSAFALPLGLHALHGEVANHQAFDRQALYNSMITPDSLIGENGPVVNPDAPGARTPYPEPMLDPATKAVIDQQQAAAQPEPPQEAPNVAAQLPNDVGNVGNQLPTGPALAETAGTPGTDAPAAETAIPVPETTAALRYETMSPHDVGVNPELQYKKTGVNDTKNAVTDSLKGTSTYDVDQGGIWTVFRDEKGDTYAVNSHHRRELAQRADRFVRTMPDGSQQEMPAEVPVNVLDAKDGWTIERARGRGALENMRDGKGTALDAMEVTRGLGIPPEKFADNGFSTTGDMAKQVAGLTQLSEDNLNRVRNGDITEAAAAGIGSVSGLEPETQNAALQDAITAKYQTFQQTQSLAREWLVDQRNGTLARENAGAQTSMLDDEMAPKVSSTRVLRVQLKDDALAALTKERSDLLKPTGAKLRDGEVIDTAARQAEAKTLSSTAAELRARIGLVYDTQATQDYVAELAGNVGNGKLSKQQATAELTQHLRDNIGRNVGELSNARGLRIYPSVDVRDGEPGAAQDSGRVSSEPDIFTEPASPAKPAKPAKEAVPEPEAVEQNVSRAGEDRGVMRPDLHVDAMEGPQPVTSAKNAVTETERAERGESPLEKQKKTMDAGFEAGKALVDSGKLDPRSLAAEVAKKARPLTDKETYALAYDRARLHKEHTETLDRLDAAIDAKDETAITTEKARLTRIESDFDTSERALMGSGTEMSAAFRARQPSLTSDYSLLALKQRMRAANPDTPLSEAEETKASETANSIAEMQKQIEDRDAKIKDLQAQRVVTRLVREDAASRRQEGSAKRQEARAERITSLDSEFTDLKKQFAKAAGKLSAGLDPTLVVLVGKMARNRISAGMTNMAGIVDHLYGELSVHLPGMTKGDIRDALASEGLIDNSKAGKAESIKQAAESVRENAQLALEQSKADRLIEGRKKINGWEKLNQAQRDFKLSSLNVFGHLLGATGSGIPTEALADIFGYAAGKISIKGIKLADIAPREGAAPLAGEGAGIRGALSKRVARSIKDTIKTGMSAIEAQAGQTPHGSEGLSSYIGRSHGVSKVLFTEYQYEKSLSIRLNKAYDSGLNIHDPEVQVQIGMGSATDAMNAKFMGDNKINTKINNYIRDHETDTDGGVQAVGFFLNTLLGIKKIGFNVVGRTVDMTGVGLIRGTAKVIKVARSGEAPTPKEATDIIKAYKYGGVALVAAYLGLVQPSWFRSSGYLNGDKNNRDEDGKRMAPGTMIFAGHTLPKVLGVTGFPNAVQFFATIRAALDNQTTTLAAPFGLVKQIPGIQGFAEAVDSVDDTASSKAKGVQGLKHYVQSQAVPAVVKQAYDFAAAHNDAKPKSDAEKRLNHYYVEGLPPQKSTPAQSDAHRAITAAVAGGTDVTPEIQKGIAAGLTGKQVRTTMKNAQEDKAVPLMRRFKAIPDAMQSLDVYADALPAERVTIQGVMMQKLGQYGAAHPGASAGTSDPVFKLARQLKLIR